MPSAVMPSSSPSSPSSPSAPGNGAMSAHVPAPISNGHPLGVLGDRGPRSSDAGQQVLTGGQAKLYAPKQIGVDLTKVAGGKTYSQVSDEWIAGGMKNAKLASERTTLFMGATLNGLPLNAWGWSVIGTIATLAGFILIFLGAALLLLPLANWQINLRGRPPVAIGA